MKKELFSNQAISIDLEMDSNLLIATWTVESEKIDDNFFKEVNQKYVAYSSEYPITYALIDTVNFQYTIAPEMQEWVANEILPKLVGAGWRKIAFLLSEDFVTQLSVEQTMEEKELPFEVRYFASKEKALQWLQ